MPMFICVHLPGDAVQGGNSVKDDVLAAYIDMTTFRTINGDVSFAADGEWARGIKDGAGIDLFRGMAYQIVLTPGELKTGEAIYPYAK